MPSRQAKATLQAPPSAEPLARYRSGAVARMLRMPVATLRIWERRYQVAAPLTTASGHRLYAATDIQRLALLKQLSDLGHAIGSIAKLDMAELQQVASTHANTLVQTQGPAASNPAPWHVVVVGTDLAKRLNRTHLTRRLVKPWVVSAVAQLASLQNHASEPHTDLLLVHMPSLDTGAAAAVVSAARALNAKATGVLYSYAPEAACQALTQAGAVLLREPQDDRALATWLNGLMGTSGPANFSNSLGLDTHEITPRRYDDATLSDFAGLSSTIACECPRHVAELLMQLSHFEAYSADCQQLSPADASLHDHLRQVAAAARALFETALERVAMHEGLMLPR